MFTLEALAIAFASFEVAWLLSVPLWHTRLSAGRILAGVGIGWLAVSGLLAWRGFFRGVETFPPPTVYIGLAGAVLLLLVALLVAPLRTATYAVGLRTMVAIHVFRGLVGAAFLSMASKSQLGPSLGYAGGVAEVLAGVGALALVVAISRLHIDRRRRWVLAYAALGTVTLATTISAWLLSLPSPWQRFGESALVAKLADFPYATLPLFFWPLVLVGLLALFARDSRF